MKTSSHYITHCFFLLLLCFSSQIIFAGNEELLKKANGWIQDPNIEFIPNKGQFTDEHGAVNDAVLYKAKFSGGEIYLTKNGLSYYFFKQEKEDGGDEDIAEPLEERANKKRREEKKLEWNRVDMDVENGNITKDNIFPEDPSDQGTINYYYANCPQGITGVQAFKKLVIKNIYPGIDWVIYSDKIKGLKYDLIVHPGADPKKISIQYKGTKKEKLSDDKRSIVMKAPFGEITEGELFSYQGSQEISSVYEMKDGKFGFGIGSYDLKKDLVIDPPVQVLNWATYYGIGGGEGASKVTTDNAGNIFVVGYCNSIPTFNPNGGAYYQSTMAGFYDGFIVKFNSAGVRLWSTYYGGTGDDQAFALVTDAIGNLYVGGYSSSVNLPLQNPNGGAYFQNANAGGWDVMILQFDNNGVRKWGTYYGGSTDEWAYDLTTDGAGNIFITGLVTSSNFPTQNLGGAYNQPGFGGGGLDAFLLRFNAAGVRSWGTYYGGNGFESGIGMTNDAAGNIYLTGGTSSLNIPMQNFPGGYNQIFAGAADAYIAKFNSNCAMVWATCYGGSNDDRGTDIAVDASNNIYVTGYTLSSTDFPRLNPGNCSYYQANFGGGSWDAYILKFDANCVRTWCTFYGGNNCEFPFALNVDNTGSVYMSGTTSSANFPLANPGNGAYFQSGFGGGSGGWFQGGDLFITQFTRTGYLLWSTYYGGSNLDWICGAAISNTGCLVTTGEWWSSNMNTLNPGSGAYYQQTFGGSEDSFVERFCPNQIILDASITPTGTNCSGNGGSATANPTGGIGPYSYSWTTSPVQTSQIATGLSSGTYTVVITDATCDTVIRVVTINQLPNSLAVTSQQVDVNCNSNCNGSISPTITGGTQPYSYVWNTSSTNQTITGLCAGNYSLTVTDVNGCTLTQTYLINQPSTLAVQSQQINVLCNGGTTGSASIVASGGTPNYSYSWAPAVGTNATVTGLSAGIYSVYVTDANGCTVTSSFNITEPTAITSTIQSSNVSCFGSCNGQATITVNGGVSPYNYVWTNSSTSTLAGNLCAGSFTCTVTDQNGCTFNDTISITQPAQLALAPTFQNSLCVPNGASASVAANGGIGPYLYQWSTIPVQTTASATGLASGNYSVVVTDANGCSATVNVSVTSPSQVLAVNPIATTAVCAGQSVNLQTQVTGGTPSYNYNWTNSNSTTSSVNYIPTASTNYTLTVTDANGCTVNVTSVITVNALPQVAITSGPASGCAPVCVNFTSSVSNAATYTWNFGGNNTSNNANPQFCFTASGNYTIGLTVTDNNGCSNTTTANGLVTVVGSPTACFTASSTIVNLNDPTVNFSNCSVNATNYLWNFGDNANTTSILSDPSFTYTDTGAITVSLVACNNLGCCDTANLQMHVREDATFYVPNAFTPTGDNLNELFGPVGIGIDVSGFQMWIYDRWGNMIYHTEDPTKGWNGHANGGAEIAQEDVYVWEMIAKDLSGIEKKYVGHVSLIK